MPTQVTGSIYIELLVDVFKDLDDCYPVTQETCPQSEEVKKGLQETKQKNDELILKNKEIFDKNALVFAENNKIKGENQTITAQEETLQKYNKFLFANKPSDYMCGADIIDTFRPAGGKVIYLSDGDNFTLNGFWKDYYFTAWKQNNDDNLNVKKKNDAAFKHNEDVEKENQNIRKRNQETEDKNNKVFTEFKSYLTKEKQEELLKDYQTLLNKYCVTCDESDPFVVSKYTCEKCSNREWQEIYFSHGKGYCRLKQNEEQQKETSSDELK